MTNFKINQLSDLENLAESEEVEFKLAHGKDGKGELPKDFWKTYSAMANAYGGWIILGVQETKSKSKFKIEKRESQVLLSQDY